jgi:2-dehydro-3-deoxygluconokinase
MPSVVTAGETMVLGTPAHPGRLRYAASLELKIGEPSPTSPSSSRLGITVGWVSCLGDYKPGQLVLDRVRAEGMDTAEVRRLQGSPPVCTCARRLATTCESTTT